jgi:PAS domain S-box-containing protein
MADVADSFGVLVVDDDDAMVDLTATHLSRLLPEATVRTETDPRTALSRLDTEPIDCLVSDYDMPDWTGLDLLDHVRTDYPQLPFILFTGKGSEEIASDAISAGVTDYLQKRVGSDRFEVLANRVRNAVSRQWAVREAERLQQFTDVIRTTQRQLVSATTPTAVCEAVCRSLTTAASYRGAWLGEYDPTTETVHGRGSAGAVPLSEETLIDVTGRPDRPLEECLAARETRVTSCPATADGDVGHSPDADTDSGHELLAIPLVHDEDDDDDDDALFGVLAIFADADYEFGETEVDVLIELSWTTTQAISATQTRQTLLDRERTLTRYETLLDVLGDPVYALDDAGRLTYVNQAFESVTGYDEEALLGEHASLLLDDETTSMLQTAVESLLEDDETHRAYREIDVRTRSGETVLCEDSIALLPDLGDGFRGTVGVVRDVEERVAAERQLRENKRKIEEIHGFAHDVANCETVESVCRRTVEAADSILEFDVCYIGLRDGEYIVPKASQNVDTPEPIRHDEGIAGEVHHSGESHVTREMAADPAADPTNDAFRSGMTVPVGDTGIFQAASFSTNGFDDRDLELAELLLSHVTEALKRVRYEAELKDERDRVAALFENLPEPAAACHATPEGPRIDDVNAEFERVFGYDRSEVAGENIDEYVVPDDDEAITLEETFYVGNTVQTEVRRETTRGVRDFQVTVIPVELDGFSTEGYVVYGDISEQKRRERELSRQNERLAEFTNIVAHDLRNPLNVAMGNLELAKESEDFERLDTAASALDRMETLIGDFLSLARQGRTVNDPTTLTLETVVRQAWRTVDTGSRATLDVDDLGVVAADAERLRTVFENLFRNAREHGDETTTLRVGMLSDGSNGFYVEDDGPGIDSETRERVFEYGYSTDAAGTGFGLAIVNRIVQAHGWEIAVTESQGGGARFEVRTE